jgi:starch synthase
MKASLKIVMITSECVPYAKTGGLADVVGALPQALAALGHEVVMVMPKYASINAAKHKLERYWDNFGVWMGGGLEWCAVDRASNRGVQTFFIENHKFFAREGLYHDASYQDYEDNPRRFAFLSRAGLQLCHDMGFKPDIVHVHDWQSALAAAYLKIWHWNDELLGKAASVLTIHNLAYQGKYAKDHYDYLGLQWHNFTPDRFEDYGSINFLKGGIRYADALNTVSPTYADETRTPEHGYGLAPFLSDRGEDYCGILNGVDYAEWNPETDKLIPANYSSNDLRGKVACKKALQQHFGLEVDPGVPVIGVVSRLAAQKGLDTLAAVADRILEQMRVQLVVVGTGDKGLEQFYRDLPTRHPGRAGSFIGYSNDLAHLVEAGCDCFVMPSIYEPCGLNQLYSLKYGTLPIVRATGGLNDTVQQYNEANGEGTGFKYQDPTGDALLNTIGWAVSTYYDRPGHFSALRHRAMAEDFSWTKSASEYLRLYDRAISNKSRL